MKGLKKIFGENATDDRLTLISYSSDASQIKGEASAVVWPKTREDVYKLIRYAHRTNSNITPRGAGTGLVGAAVPHKSIVVDFSRMDRIISIDTKNKTAVVEPGVVLDTLNNEVAKYNLEFPVVPASHSTCTIGGMISTNAAGMKALRHGSTMEWIEELVVMDGMGRVLKAAKKDRIADFCGTEGTMGIILNAKLRLADVENIKTLDLFKVETVSDMINIFKSLDIKKLNSVEYIDKTAASIAGLEPKYYVFVEYNDDSGEIFKKEEVENTLEIRKTAGIALSSEGYTIKEDPKLPIGKVSEFIRWLEQHGIPSFGHLGAGILHPRFKTSDLIPEMFRKVNELGGEVSGEHGIGIKKKEFVTDKYRERITRLKAKYDPKNILNRNKLI